MGRGQHSRYVLVASLVGKLNVGGRGGTIRGEEEEAERPKDPDDGEYFSPEAAAWRQGHWDGHWYFARALEAELRERGSMAQ